jgi:hypothetical protein
MGKIESHNRGEGVTAGGEVSDEVELKDERFGFGPLVEERELGQLIIASDDILNFGVLAEFKPLHQICTDI